MEVLVLWALFALLPAMVASSKGRSGLGWFLIGLLITPILATVIVAVLPSPNEEAARHAELVAAASRVAGAPSTAVAEDPISAVQRLAALRDSGAISTAEFEAKKAELLSRI